MPAAARRAGGGTLRRVSRTENDALEELLGRPATSPPLAAIRLRAARVDELRDTTSGEVTRAQTLSFETLETIEGGLFCERLFGAIAVEGKGREARARALDSAFLRARDDEVLPPRERMETFARITPAIAHPLTAHPDWRERLASAGLGEWPLEVVPVLPPELRAIVPVQGTEGIRFVVSDLNDLYRHVLAANARMARLRDLRAPASIIDVESSRVAESVAQLVDNARSGEPRVGPNGRPLVGLLGMLAHPTRPTWSTLAELDGMVARGVVRALRPPLAKRHFALIAYLRALGIVVEITTRWDDQVATVH
jgi:hypothetical protein